MAKATKMTKMTKMAKKPMASKSPVRSAVKAKAPISRGKPVEASPAKTLGKKSAEGKKAAVVKGRLEKEVPVKIAQAAQKKSEASQKELKTKVVEMPAVRQAEVQPVEPKLGKKAKALKAAAEKVLSEDLKRWSDYRDKFGSERTVPYSMSGVFEAKQSISHKVLGWGYILSVQNDRLEVLFESGTKMLISNYKAG